MISILLPTLCIGIPAVALSGASAANGMVGVVEQWMCMDELKSRGAI